MQDQTYNLCEITDNKNRLLCVMPFEYAHMQNLHYRALAIVLRTAKKHWYLKWPINKPVSFSCFHFLPYGHFVDDYAKKLLFDEWNLINVKWKKLGLIHPSINNTAFITVFEAIICAKPHFLPEKNSEFAMLDSSELISLVSYGNLVDPLFNFCIDNYLSVKSFEKSS